MGKSWSRRRSNRKQIVEESGCKIHQYLDHGFLAYCPRSDKALGAVTQTLENLRRLQQKSPTRFRILLHYGAAFLDGTSGASGEPTLSGREFELILALDGLAGQMKADSLITESARVHLRSQLPVIDAGRQTLSGLGEIQLYSLASG